MKKRMVILAGILAVSMSAAPFARAEETLPAEEAQAVEETSLEEELGELLGGLLAESGLGEKLAEAGEAVKELLPEGTDLEGMIKTIAEQVEVVKDQQGELVDNIVTAVKDKLGDIDPEEKLGEIAGKILEAVKGEEEFDFSSLEAYMERHAAIKDVIKEYVSEKNTEFLEAGDEQIISLSLDYKEELEEKELHVLSQCTECNFKLEGTELHMLNAAADTIMFTIREEEDGTYTVADAMLSEDGEGYSASIEKMAEAAGFTPEEAYEVINDGELMYIFDLESYLNEHPEITGIEYAGEICNADELNDISLELMNTMYAEEEEAEGEGTEAAEEETEAAAAAEEAETETAKAAEAEAAETEEAEAEAAEAEAAAQAEETETQEG